jgi:hypothetical protein
MTTPDRRPVALSRRKRPSAASLVVCGAIGLIVGLVIGANAVLVRGFGGVGGTTVNVRVEVFGVTVRQGRGPEEVEPVAWTWGVGLLALFALAGAGVGVAGRVAVSELLRALRGPGGHALPGTYPLDDD